MTTDSKLDQALSEIENVLDWMTRLPVPTEGCMAKINRLMKAQECIAAHRSEQKGEPMSEEQIKAAFGASDDYWATSKLWMIAAVRAAERHHGIGSKHEAKQ